MFDYGYKGCLYFTILFTFVYLILKNNSLRHQPTTEKQIAARDTALQGLAQLLDGQVVMDELNRCLPDIGARRIEKKYIRYKPGTSCLVRYELESNYGNSGIYAKVHGPKAWNKLKKAGNDPIPAGPDDIGRLVVAKRNMVISSFPNDDRLNELFHLSIPSKKQDLLKHIFPHQPALHQADMEILQYKPERRYVACLRQSGVEQVALKLYEKRGFAAAQQVCHQLKKSGDRTFPTVVGESQRYMAIAFQWIAGPRLSDIFAKPDFDLEWLRELGHHLAEFHRRPNVNLLVYLSPEHKADNLMALARTVEFIAPEYAERTRALAQKVGDLLKLVPLEYTQIHGDFYAKQVLCTANGIQLVDCDDVVFGHPAADLGLFIAHLERDVMRGFLTRECTDRLEQALLQGYPGAMDSRLFEQIQLYTAVGLLQLIHHPFRNCEPDYLELMELILAACENRLATFTH